MCRGAVAVATGLRAALWRGGPNFCADVAVRTLLEYLLVYAHA